MTIAALGGKAEVARALAPGRDGRVSVWDGKRELRLIPLTPIVWTPSPLYRGMWRGQREAAV